MKPKKKIKTKPDTLEGLFESILTNAKSNAAAGEALGKYLMSLVSEIGILTTNLATEINSTLVAIDKEMEGKNPVQATPEALRLRARAASLGWVSEQISGMVNKLKEEKYETIH